MEIRSLSRSGQSAVEFTFLLLFVLFIATLVTVLLQQNLDREIERLDRQIVQEFRNVWYEEVSHAAEAPQGYSRSFQVNSNPRGFPVISRFGDAPDNVTDELVISYKDYEFLFFLPTDVDYSGVGQNVSLSDGVKLSRRCHEECKVFVYGDKVAPGDQDERLDSEDTQLSSMDFLTGDSQLLFGSGQDKFVIVNASAEANLTRLSNGTTTGGAQFNRVTSYGGIAAAPRKAGSKIELVNISDPRNPTDAGLDTLDFSGAQEPNIMVFDYPYGYVVTEEPSLHVFSVANWSDVREIDSVSAGPGGIDAVYDPRGYVFTAGDSANVGVYDVKDRFDVSLANDISSIPGSEVESVSYRNEDLFVVEQDAAAVYDVSDVNNPSRSQVTGLNAGNDGVIWRDYWFVSETDGYTIIDIADPDDPSVVKEVNGYSDVAGIHVDHDAVYLGYGSNASVVSVN